jgi:hypothetical protein
MFRQLESFINAPPPIDINKAFTGKTNIDVHSPLNASYLANTNLNNANNICLKAKSIQDVINLNQQGPTQCGWYHHSSNSSLDKAYLSTAAGPVKGLSTPAPTGYSSFYFGPSLAAGAKQINIERCNLVKDCEHIGTYPGCGYCMANHKAIPVDNKGKPKYPEYGCAETIITNSSQCPALPSPTRIPSKNTKIITSPEGKQLVTGIIRPQQLIKSTANCKPEANGRLSGSCLQSSLISQGCTDNGALFTALNGFSNTSDINSVEKRNSNISTYMTTKPTLNLNNFLKASTMQNADTQAHNLALSAQRAKNIPVSKQKQTDSLAIDLCIKEGYYLENYDFCAELKPSTPKPSEGYLNACRMNGLRMD